MKRLVWNEPEIWRQALIRKLMRDDMEELAAFWKVWPTTYWFELVEVS